MPCRPSNTVRPILFALALGAFTTVTLAWAAMFFPNGDHGYGPPTVTELGIALDDSGESPRYIQVWEGASASHRVISYWWMQVSGQSLVFSQPYDYESRKAAINALPRHMQPDSLGDIVMQSSYREVGWPMKALTCAVHWETQIRNENIIYHVEGGLQLPRDKNFQPRALPLVPVWPGFAVNLVLYAATWLAVFHLARGLRRWRRVRGNRCIHCGYLRTGLPSDSRCPECGKLA